MDEINQTAGHTAFTSNTKISHFLWGGSNTKYHISHGKVRLEIAQAAWTIVPRPFEQQRGPWPSPGQRSPLKRGAPDAGWQGRRAEAAVKLRTAKGGRRLGLNLVVDLWASTGEDQREKAGPTLADHGTEGSVPLFSRSVLRFKLMLPWGITPPHNDQSLPLLANSWQACKKIMVTVANVLHWPYSKLSNRELCRPKNQMTQSCNEREKTLGG